MALEKGNINAILNLGIYHQKKTNNYNLMKKYYLMYYKIELKINSIKEIYYCYKFSNYNNL
jgi:hypothetical protein